MALQSFGSISSDNRPGVVVPALIEFVSRNHEVTRLQSTHNTFELTDGMAALAKFGAQSNSLPVMLSLLEHPNRYVREAASNDFLPLIANATAQQRQ